MNQTATYSQIVNAWAEERALLNQVQPHTVQKSRQKALLFAPYLDEKPAREIKTSDIISALKELGCHGGRAGNGRSSATLRAVHLAGTQALDWAIRQGSIAANPFHQVPRPKARYRTAQFLTCPAASKLTAQMTSELDKQLVAGNIERAAFCLAVCIALATGMRRGEIFALRWDDYDNVHLRLSISKAIKADGQVGEPKSKSGIRSVAIGAGLASLLEEVKSWQDNQLPAATELQSRSIICNDSGNPANMNAFEHWWRRWADSRGWEGLRFHELRHTHATLLIANGTDVKTVQMRLGHSSAEITMSIYAHAIPLSDGNAASLLDASLFN